MTFLRAVRIARIAPPIVLALAAGVIFTAHLFSQAPASAYILVASSGRRPLPFRSTGGVDQVALDQLAAVFDLRVQDDPQAGGLIVIARNQRVMLTPGQPLVSVSGRLVQLSGPIQRQGSAIYVPVDFLSRALGPALALRLDVRPLSRLIIVGDLRVPQVSPRFERQGANGRLIIDVQPPAAHRTTRDGNRLTIRFDADALDLPPTTTNIPPEFAGQPRVETLTLVIDLGPSALNVRLDDADPAHVNIDIGGPAPPPPGRGALAPPPAVDLAPAGTIRTVAIDPGHGGDDAGARGGSGAVEKDVTLQVARRLKAAIESRIGLRVLLTREGDEGVAVDRRTSLANNNKADLLISLHVNASLQPSARGAQVLSLSLDDYKDRAKGLPVSLPVPVVGGGTRVIDAMPWDLAQLPFAPQSSSFAAIVIRRLTEAHIPLYTRPSDQAPLRVLVGANMPAVLVEMGFLSNSDDERALVGGDTSGAIVDVLVNAILEVRNGVPVTPAEPAR